MAGKVELDCSVKMDQVLVVDTLKLQWLQPTKTNCYEKRHKVHVHVAHGRSPSSSL